MRAAIFNGPKSIEVGERPDPVIVAPTDAVVRVVLACVCGSDLWYYRGTSSHAVGSIGHEFIVGDAGLHARHEIGTEPSHAARPGEVSVPAEATAETTFGFDGSGAATVMYACHLPGHLRYGMAGEVAIVR